MQSRLLKIESQDTALRVTAFGGGVPGASKREQDKAAALHAEL